MSNVTLTAEEVKVILPLLRHALWQTGFSAFASSPEDQRERWLRGHELYRRLGGQGSLPESTLAAMREHEG